MTFNDITSRLTGISCPIFGVSTAMITTIIAAVLLTDDYHSSSGLRSLIQTNAASASSLVI